MPGTGELIIILVIVLLIFGAGKLPAIGDALGKSIKNFRRAASGDNEIEVSKSAKKRVEGKKTAELSDANTSADDDIEDAEVVAVKTAKKDA